MTMAVEWAKILWSATLYVVLPLLGSVILAGILWWRSRPHLKGPSFGTMGKRFEQEREKMFVRVLEETGDLSIELGTFIVTADPQVIKTLFNSKEHVKTRSRLYKFSRYVFYGMDGILNLDGDEHARHERTLKSIFHGSHVDKHEKMVETVVGKHLASWKRGETAELGVLPSRRHDYGSSFYNQEPFPSGKSFGSTSTIPEESSTGGPDLLSAVRGIALDVILLYGYNVNPSSETGVALASELSLYPQLVGVFSNTGALMAWNFRKLVQCTNRIRHIVKEIRDERPAKNDSQGSTISDGENFGSSPNFIDNMIRDGYELKEMAAEVNHIHGAHKAVAFVLTCMLWRLSKHPEWVQKLREEWRNHLKAGELPRQTDLEKFPVTRAVIHECLRMHVVSLGVVRRTGEPLEIGGKVIPAGTEIVVLLHALHHHPKFWENPLTFDPSRFLEGKPAPYTFLPFLTGKRMCAGKHLAELQLAVVLYTLLRDHDIRTGVDELVLKADMYSALDVTIPFTMHAIN
eukprot:gb/GECG01008537.1/.p1 GENE.gb/GECG01008537.1/~~gb/GECG01008537.1/.p1  ORF type:complete len:517 (+),score=45.17 gb/GECG01008537.1/:1-1551(+)